MSILHDLVAFLVLISSPFRSLLRRHFLYYTPPPQFPIESLGIALHFTWCFSSDTFQVVPKSCFSDQI